MKITHNEKTGEVTIVMAMSEILNKTKPEIKEHSYSKHNVKGTLILSDLKKKFGTQPFKRNDKVINNVFFKHRVRSVNSVLTIAEQRGVLKLNRKAGSTRIDTIQML